jgi:hypothetical protein
MRLTALLLTAVLLLMIAPIALADSIQLSVNSNFAASIDSPDDNFWGEYSTTRGLYDLPSTGPAVTSTTSSDLSLFVPAGSTITGATIQIFVPTEELEGTAALYPEQAFMPPGDGPSIPPIFSGHGTSDVEVDFDQDLSFPLNPIVNGDEVSTGDLNLYFDLNGSFDDSVTYPGSNWDGYVGADGEVDIPYIVQLDVTYSPAPTPEPSSIVFLGTGLLALAEIARRKLHRE